MTTPTLNELIKQLSNSMNKPLYIQTGFNRFEIVTIIEEEDHILLLADEDANNPIGYPKDKSVA